MSKTDPFDDTVTCDFAAAARHFAAVRDEGLADVEEYERWAEVCCREGFGIGSDDFAAGYRGAGRAFIAGAAAAALTAHTAHASEHPDSQLRALTINGMLSTSGGAPEADISAALAAEVKEMRARPFGNGVSDYIDGDPEAAFRLGTIARDVGEDAAAKVSPEDNRYPVRLAADFASNYHGDGLVGRAVSEALYTYSRVLRKRSDASELAHA